jgi:(1->4)-alpha-D-glucan 1-alpha-D-glucosylmutase
VLENGPSSRYAAYFDVDWDSPETRLRNMMLLPVLGHHYGRVLEAGELRLGYQDAAFPVRYLDHTFPVNPRSLEPLLGAAAGRCPSDLLAFLADAFGRLPWSTATNWVSLGRRHRN